MLLTQVLHAALDLPKVMPGKCGKQVVLYLIVEAPCSGSSYQQGMDFMQMLFNHTCESSMW